MYGSYSMAFWTYGGGNIGRTWGGWTAVAGCCWIAGACCCCVCPPRWGQMLQHAKMPQHWVWKHP